MKRFPIKYVTPRGDGWRYRRLVPEDLHESLGKKTWTRLWPVGTDAATVMHEARLIARRHDLEIARARGDAEAEQIAQTEGQARDFLKRPPAERFESLAYLYEHDDSEAGRRFLATVEGGGTYHRPVLLSEAVKRHSVGLDQKPFVYALKSFEAVHGDPDVMTIRRSDVAAWIDHEHRRGLKPSTIRRRLDALRASTERAILDGDLDKRNPFAKHSIRGGQGGPSDRVPLHRQHLDLIDTYMRTAPRLRPDTRNLIRLLMMTGAGTAEIAGAEVRDVVLDGAVPYLWIRENDTRRLKTPARDRQVPLLPEALEAARDAVDRASGRSELFEGYGRGGRGAEYFSSRLNQALRRAGVPRSPRLTVYSLRHTWAEALRAAGIGEDMRRRLLGHAGRGIPSRYGADRAHPAEALAAMERALPLLGEIAPAVYQPGELA